MHIYTCIYIHTYIFTYNKDTYLYIIIPNLTKITQVGKKKENGEDREGRLLWMYCAL